MSEKIKRNNVHFRPHFKTHQSAEVGRWFMDAGINSITVSSVSMAEYFAGHGWSDITIAFTVNLAEVDQINILASKICLNLCIESDEALEFLTKKISHNVGIFLKIDTVLKRTGIAADNIPEIAKLIKKLKTIPKLKFKGFLVHNGHTYKCSSSDEIKKIHFESLKKLQRLKQIFYSDFPGLIISMGDTPTCSLINDFSGVDELRPGNFVFYDLMQKQLGSCTSDDIAVALACPVVAKYPERNEIVVYGGAVHLSKDYIIDKKGNKIFGEIVLLKKNGWSRPMRNTIVKSLSQEHGIIFSGEHELFEKTGLGDFIGILPVHSCLTANLMKKYYIF